MKVAEQYTRATNSRNLKVQEFFCDADKLIAAGWVAGSNDRKALALTLQRWMAGDLRGMHQTVEMMACWVNRKQSISQAEALDITRAVCAWWMHRVCPVCDGHGHPLLADAPVLDESKECPACAGTGVRSLTEGMTKGQADVAEWLVSTLEAVTPVAFGEMAQRLKTEMTF